MTQIKSLQTGIKFKDTPIGKIPVDWEVSSLDHLTLLHKGSIKIGPFGSQLKKEELVANGIKVYGQENVMKNNFQIGNRFISYNKFESLKSVEVFPGDLLMTMMGSIGFCAVVPPNTQKGIMDSHLLRIRIDPQRVYTDFLSELIQDSTIVKQQIDKLSQGGIMSGLNSAIVRALLLPLPPLSEQTKITDILFSIDNAIEETDRIIEKTKTLKKGLMQKLLTHGIGHKKFKKTEIGEIPEEWDLATLRDLYKTPIRDFGSFSLTKLVKYVDSGVPFLRSDNFRDGKFIAENIKFIQSDAHKALTKSTINRGTLMFTKIGNIGHADIYNGSLGECNSNATIAKIDIDKSKAFPPFIRWVFNSKVAAKQYKTKIISTPPRINLGEISNLTIPMPSHNEQKKIADILDSFENLATEEDCHKKELETLKASLMQVLLTGRVRVKLD
jgi:type I restriction enzyme, S subunit